MIEECKIKIENKINEILDKEIKKYEDNEFMICKQEDDFYIMGASRNANYIGYKLNECDISNKELMEGNLYILINTYEKYEMKAFS